MIVVGVVGEAGDDLGCHAQGVIILLLSKLLSQAVSGKL